MNLAPMPQPALGTPVSALATDGNLSFVPAQTADQCNYAGGRLYCLQDLPLVFGDGFESGDTDAWGKGPF